MPFRDFEFPEDKQDVLRKAIRMEWITLAYMASAVVVVFLTLGSSQAMKAAWVEDMLSLLPPAAFLVANRFRTRGPDRQFPWGYHRAVSIAFLAAATALLLMGVFVAYDSGLKLVKAEHPPIGLVELFGQQIWLGWLMIAALVYTGVPPVILGQKKKKLAAELHEKVLYADAEMNRADWMTAGAAAVGILGIGFGLWWADSVAALFISFDIARDGWTNVKAAVGDLMDSRPTTYDHARTHPVIGEMEELLRGLDWVRDARVRLREHGHVFAGEAFVVPTREDGLVGELDRTYDRLRELDWRLHDVVMVPVDSLERREGDEPPAAQSES
jgi:cation diffusion facilitator family transporter